MKKFNNVKSKVATAVLVTSLVAGAGTALAATDAGAQLNQIYKKGLATAQATITGDLFKYIASNSPDKEYQNIKNTGLSEVKAAGNNEITRASAEINTVKATYSGQLSSSLTDINNKAPQDFDKFVTDTNKGTNTLLDLGAAIAEGDITRAINDEGKKQVANVNKEVGKTKQEAIDALTKEIADAKAAINELLKNEQATATAEVKANVDSKVAELKAKIKAATDALVALKKAEISTAGNTIETAAKAELEQLVKDITKK